MDKKVEVKKDNTNKSPSQNKIGGSVYAEKKREFGKFRKKDLELTNQKMILNNV